ncbi:hypothetical protein XA68_16052 [Ophiocordyceps unilateralis]|uniref:Uncharacterized protein n=1 Tax=Ophiocordyceps unilateralis TaxID=268505 RepID=A0A2A9P5P9_OPHUN|nr:hypothetical protein XA68_16052 [Ophiocordyceps unilateralis]
MKASFLAALWATAAAASPISNGLITIHRNNSIQLNQPTQTTDLSPAATTTTTNNNNNNNNSKPVDVKADKGAETAVVDQNKDPRSGHGAQASQTFRGCDAWVLGLKWTGWCHFAAGLDNRAPGEERNSTAYGE